jgi:tetratricopeptide (TPR) repeat protein
MSVFLPVVFFRVRSDNHWTIPLLRLLWSTAEVVMFNMLRHACPILVLLLFLLANSPSTPAQLRQSGEIRGQVRYSQGGAPAVDVVVRLEQLSGGSLNEARTDRLGRFTFSNLARIQYHVVIRHFGYKEIQREVNLIMASSDYLQLQLVSDEAKPTPAKVSKILDASVPPQARKEFEKAEVLLATGEKARMSEGVQHLEKAIVIYPSFLEAKLRLGTTYMDLMQWSQAEKILRQANEAHPRTPNILFALGELLLQQEKSGEAEKVLREGLQLEPRSWQGRFTLGRLYWHNNDIVKAGRQVGLAIQLNPMLAEAHLLAGNIFLRARKNQEAEFEFEEYLRLAPKGKYASDTKQVLQKIKKARAQNGGVDKPKS